MEAYSLNRAYRRPCKLDPTCFLISVSTRSKTLLKPSVFSGLPSNQKILGVCNPLFCTWRSKLSRTQATFLTQHITLEDGNTRESAGNAAHQPLFVSNMVCVSSASTRAGHGGGKLTSKLIDE